MSWRNRVFHFRVVGYIQEQLQQNYRFLFSKRVERVLTAMKKRTFYKPSLIALSLHSQSGSIVQAKRLANAFRDYGAKHKYSNLIKIFLIVHQFIVLQRMLSRIVDQLYLLVATKFMLVKIFTKLYHQDPYSIFGDFGFVYRNFGMKQFAEKWHYTRETFTSGEKKNKFDPYKDVKPEDEKWIKGILSEMEFELKKEVTKNRQYRIQELSINAQKLETNLFNPSIINSEQALELGLIDQIANLDDIVKNKFNNNKINVIFDSTTQSPYIETPNIIDQLAMRMHFPY